MKSTTIGMFLVLLSLPALAQQGQEAKKDQVVTVGPGGISSHEYEVYQKRHANKLGKPWLKLSEEERKQALETAIDDELIFQGALGEGLHKKDEYTRNRIIRMYKSKQTTARISPRLFPEKEIEAYYRAHPKEFTVPQQVKLKALQFPRGDKTATKTIAKARRNPSSVKGWKCLGWKQDGQMLSGTLSKSQKAQVYSLRKGQVSSAMKERMGLTFVFWATDRKEPYVMSYGKARGKVKSHMIKAKQQKLEGDLRSRLGRQSGGVGSSDELMFQAAMKAKTHRIWNVRKGLINLYVANKKKKGMPKDRLLMMLRQRYKVATPMR